MSMFPPSSSSTTTTTFLVILSFPICQTLVVNAHDYCNNRDGRSETTPFGYACPPEKKDEQECFTAVVSLSTLVNSKERVSLANYTGDGHLVVVPWELDAVSLPENMTIRD